MPFYYATTGLTDARLVLVGMPLDRTSSFAPGTRFGPDFARIGADNIESFSPYQRRDIFGLPIHDSGNLAFTYETPSAPFSLITATTRNHYTAGRQQLAIGGEHTITPVIVAELSRIYPDLCVIQFDAHADLREEFLGEKLCHATAMRRVLDHIPRDRLFQLGLRSFSRPEEMVETNVFPFEVARPVSDICRVIGARPTYITLDLDVLDPGAMPDVQTPEPGGCFFPELAHSLAHLSQLNVIGGDIVEFCPRDAQPSIGASVTAELIRELILVITKP
ncbi:MAG: agmatinase [candidate division WOR-3 bacterium]